MAEPLSHISVEDLNRLNAFAKSDSPSSQENLGRLIKELASSNKSSALCGQIGYLVVGGRGVCTQNSYGEIEAILDFPDFLQHPVEQVSACVALLRRSHHSRDDIQRRLSHLLVEYPVLMDHRLVFAVGAPRAEWSSLGVALAEASYASLPTLSDGLSARQLKDFACNPSVKSSLWRPNAAFPPGTAARLNGRTALDVCTNGVGTFTPPADPLATRGAFLTSLLSLSDLARSFTGRALLDPQKARFNEDKLGIAIAKVVFDVALHRGRYSAVTPEQLRAVLALRSPFAIEGDASGSERDVDYSRTVATATRNDSTRSVLLTHCAALVVGNQIFEASASPKGPSEPKELGNDVIHDRTRCFLDSMVFLGIAKDRASAANWLIRITVGPQRADKSEPGPQIGPSSILGFLEALHEAGASVELQDKPPGSAVGVTLESWNTWITATQVFSTTKAMEGVYAKHAATPLTQPATAQAPLARARRRQV